MTGGTTHTPPVAGQHQDPTTTAAVILTAVKWVVPLWAAGWLAVTVAAGRTPVWFAATLVGLQLCVVPLVVVHSGRQRWLHAVQRVLTINDNRNTDP